MIYGIGDSNLEFNGYGYAGALRDVGMRLMEDTDDE